MIVTGIFDLEKYEKRGRSTRSYIDAAGWLLSSTVPLIIFSSSEYRHLIEMKRPVGGITIWEDAGGEPLEVPAESAIVRSKFRWNPRKDTPRYFAIMRRKLSWLRRGAEIARGPVTWVDLALPGELSGTPWALIEGNPRKIRLADVSYVPRAVRECRELFYADHYWPVAGGVIRGNPDDLAWLDERVEEEWQWCLKNRFAVTDEMMLGFIRYRYPERFDTYYADHPTLVQNWHGVYGSRDLVMRMAFRALDDGDVEEAERRYSALA